MTDSVKQVQVTGSHLADALKGWMMVALTLIFVGLYVAALVGWLKPLADVTMITRLEPIIFVIIGYYFGRLPAQQNEKSLKDEIDRQTKKADAAQQVKEQVQKEREVMEEKIKNAKVALRPEIYEAAFSVLLTDSNTDSAQEAQPSIQKSGLLNRSLETARRILDS